LACKVERDGEGSKEFAAMKPKLCIVGTNNSFRYKSIADSPAVKEKFDVEITTEFKGNCDLAWTQTPFISSVFKKLKDWGGPYVLHVGGDVLTEFATLPDKLRSAVDTFRRSKKVICISRYLADLYTSKLGDDNFVGLKHGLWGCDHSDRGIVPSRFEKKISWNIDSKPLIVMAITMSVENKWRGLPLFLHAAGDLLEKMNVKVVCSGKKKSQHAVVEKLQNQYRFFEFRWFGNEWPKLLSSADMFVHPSLFDGWPRSLAEAMCVGLPTIAYDVAGASEVSRTNILVDPRDSNALRAVLHDQLTNESSREKVGKANAVEAIRLTEKHRNDYADLLVEILGEKT